MKPFSGVGPALHGTSARTVIVSAPSTASMSTTTIGAKTGKAGRRDDPAGNRSDVNPQTLSVG